ncbi:helix-turn-helix domain-containing protein [Pseudomonas eucalypticola]|uniref:Helix-turn-helix domain-containing protein n=1 Tax=Pseudomonas eucalypticola TaxID=2599595 RepID=A0A7D5HY77_9PSED|nr:helix-turn-helix domain-containing protein [Pseudomonas eucalypticola]QKZ05451.1 helix-turn-helix domain-containing protein [Pseudomonas eucalypticola]
MSIQFTTDSVAPRERLAYWQEVVCDTFVPLECRLGSPEAFEGHLQAVRLGELSLVEVRAQAQTVVRDRRAIAHGDAEYVLLSLAREGRAGVEQEGREACLQVGDFAIYDTRRPYRLHFDGAFRQTVVQIPRASLQRRLGNLEYLTALPMSRNHPLQRLAADFLLGLGALEDQLPSAQQVCLGEQGLDLLAMALFQRGQEQGAVAGSARCTALLLRIKDYVKAHLGDAELNVAAVSACFGVTPRYVNRLFQQEQTSFGRYLLLSRLQRCARDLRDPALAARQISEIAYRWGFVDMAHFSRAFRTRFETTPREYRRG